MHLSGLGLGSGTKGPVRAQGPGRAVLMDQDVLHRVSMPSLQARRPRYSLVWKLVFSRREATDSVSAAEGAQSQREERETICRPEWGVPSRIG